MDRNIADLQVDAMMLWAVILEDDKYYDWLEAECSVGKQYQATVMVGEANKTFEIAKDQGYEEPYDFEFLPAYVEECFTNNWQPGSLKDEQILYIATKLTNRYDEMHLLHKAQQCSRQTLSAGRSVYQHADMLGDIVDEHDAVSAQPEVKADDEPFIAIS